MKSEIQKANAERLMKQFRESMAAAEAADVKREDRPAITRPVFEEMQARSPNIDLHRVRVTRRGDA